jgi:hypothetical protein
LGDIKGRKDDVSAYYNRGFIYLNAGIWLWCLF